MHHFLKTALLLVLGSVSALAQEGAALPAGRPGPGCGMETDFFRDEVWAKVGAQSCIECHKAGGDAEDSRFLLVDPSHDSNPQGRVFLARNQAAFAKMALSEKEGKSRLLLKATGELAHQGEQVVKPDSSAYRILAEFVRQAQAASGGTAGVGEAGAVPADDGGKEGCFFDGIAMLGDRALLRRVTLSLAARLPLAAELAGLSSGSPATLDALLDAVMNESAFYERLAEGFNDIFLVRGYGDGAESALSYEFFENTRHWTQEHDLNHIADAEARQKARYKLADDYREALLREPLELVKYIVRKKRPFSEIITADYIMVSPYTARGYGIFEEMREQFTNVDDPYEYLPVRLKSLRSRNEHRHQKSESGFYPHAGMLSVFQYLRRYPTTETNRNRLRARMYYQHFLGVDVLELAARVTDAAAAGAKYKVPVMEAPQCVVCHKTLDPVAGVFQDYYSLDGVFGPRDEGWFTDVFPPGFEGAALPPAEQWRALQWLGGRTVEDPRFARTMVQHVYFILTGRSTLLPPGGIDDPLFNGRYRAWRAQQEEIKRIALRFTASGFDLKVAFKEWILSPFYRADGMAVAERDPPRLAELADVGVARLLGPEQLERKIAAIFGMPWGRLKEAEDSLLYGGIDSNEVTERAADPSGAMGAIQRTMANDVACKHTAKDFAEEPALRRLFPSIDPDVVPDDSADTDRRIREAIVHLHQLLLGQEDAPDSPEVTATLELFTGILLDARGRKEVEARENYYCWGEGEGRPLDPDYTIRAWRGVVTYLLRRSAFLYE